VTNFFLVVPREASQGSVVLQQVWLSEHAAAHQVVVRSAF
jgi:hypothetical protein